MKAGFVALLLTAAAFAGASTVHTDVVGGYLFVDAKINGKPARLVVDSGAGMNALNPEAAKRLGVTGGTAIDATGAGSTKVKATISTLKRLEVGSASVENESVIVVPLPKELRCDGLVGYGFLHHFVVGVDYQAGTISFDAPSKFTPSKTAKSFALKVNGGIPTVEGSVEGLDGWFNVDTGAGGSLSLFTPFVDKNKLRDRFPNRVSMITGAGVGGVTMGDMTRISSIKIGDFVLPPLMTDLSTQKSGVFASEAQIGNIGYDILHRFRVTIDYPGQHLLLEKSSGFDDPSDVNRSGLYLTYLGDDPSVFAIVPNTAGAEAGLKAGDKIIQIDGVATKDIHPLLVRAALRRSAGTTLRLLVQRGQETPFEVAIKLRELVP